MENKITQCLFALQDLKYKEFQSKLMPTVNSEVIIGVSTPKLRKLYTELNKDGEMDTFLHSLPHIYYEENNLHGILIEKMKDYQECIRALNAFLPYVDNWATCDLISPKIFKKHLPELLEQIKIWISSEHTYTIRFGVKMLMTFYLEEHFSLEYPDMVAKIKSQEYYINMMIAWYFATALAKQYDVILPYLTEHRLEMWTHNKIIQKAVESYRITPEQKGYLKTLRRK